MTSSLQDTYDSHPLNADAILQRLSPPHRALTALDLAFDPATFVTDQNHVGGLATVIQLGEAVRVSATTRVCDIGGGLGGPARVLATLFGCTVHVIDSSGKRCRDCLRLSGLVSLQDRVTVECADAMTALVGAGRFDVLWGQSAWVHFDDLGRFLRHWSPALTDTGAVAIEDAFLQRPPDPAEQDDLSELEQIWHCRIPFQVAWSGALESAGFSVTIQHDLSFLAGDYFSTLTASALPATDLERQGWRLGARLAAGGLLGYGRWVARRA